MHQCLNFIKEFELVLNDIKIFLNSIILNDKLENYDDERLNQELLTLVYNFMQIN